MGIKHLWQVLEPYAERKPLSELEGKVVCVDLSGWVCESMNITDYKIQPKMYIKQLFFRTSYLLLANITPVFITEGETPELKFQVIAKRNEMQFMGARPRTAAASQNKKDPKGRTRFNHILKQCEELITCLGINAIQPPGEAEAYAAHLNALGLIDGVISQDSDCFAYGARRVFRNFSVTQGSAGVVDVYDLERINKVGSLDIGQDKVIVMGLLCGCDYCPDGVEGVGKDGALKLMSLYSNLQILDAIQGWRYELSKYQSMESRVADSTNCTSCGHSGKLASHTRKGCAMCGMSQGCKPGVWKEQRLAMKSELQIRSKALLNKDFPSKEVIHEFKKKLERPKSFDTSWKQPNIVKFVKVMGRQLDWSEIYAFEKVFPLLTRWQLYQTSVVQVSAARKGFVVPSFIKKKRTIRSIPSYEIIWKDEHNYFKDLIPDDQLNQYLMEHDDNVDSLWTTIEPAVLVDQVYPHLIETFEAEKLAKKKKPKTKRGVAKSPSSKAAKNKKSKPSDSLNNFGDMQSELEAIKIKPKRGVKKPAAAQKIDKYFKDGPPQIDDSILAFPDCDLDEEVENIQDLSNLISDIVSRSPIVKRIQGHDLVYAEFRSECENEVQVPEEKNQSLDDIDLMIMKKGKRPTHKRVNSLRMELLSSTPNSKCSPDKPERMEEGSFFAPADQNDAFESSYNDLIRNHSESEEEGDDDDGL